MARVVLTTPTLEDEAAFLAANRASRSFHRPWAYHPLTPEAYRAYLATLGERKAGYLARRREDDAIVGWINLGEIVRGNFANAYLGYSGFAAHAGRGYMTEAVALVLREAFVTLAPAPRGGQHPAGQRGVDRARATARIRAGGHVPAVPEDRRALARS